MRSRAAASMLSDKGFSEIFNMEGGIRAWDGFISEGLPDAGIAYFPEDATYEELIGLAWILEDGSRRFYSEIAVTLSDDSKKLFADLVKAEEHHKTSLLNLFKEFSGKDPEPGFPGAIMAEEEVDDVMEGGMRVSEALSWIRGKDPAQIIELAMALETNSYDLYIKMGRRIKDGRAQEVFHALAAEEKKHLERLAAELEKML